MKSLRASVLKSAILWIVLIAILHGWLNLHINPFAAGKAEGDGEKFRVGFIPVTCHLTCPVTDFINKNLEGENFFDPIRFNGWPELKEAFLARYTKATFILAPLAMKLREDGIPIKIVYLGHRDGTSLMVHKDSLIYRFEDLRGKTVAIPNRYSNQRLLILKAMKDRGMTFDEINMVEMPPPDMPVALATKSVDAITAAEPFMAQTELDGYGRTLYATKDIWPNFISCVLAVHEDSIRNEREVIQQLVDGIARSGKWLDQTMDHRMQAAQFVSKHYYNQNPELLGFVLSKPPDRVKYTNLAVRRPDFEEIEELAVASGVLKGQVHFDDYCDGSFIAADATVPPYAFEMAAPVKSGGAP
jgi:NitT/TauT family transport system substrate-binding protein